MTHATPASIALAVLLSPGLAGLVGTPAAAQSGPAPAWPRWGGPHGDFIVDAAPLADRWPEDGPPLLWSRTLGAGHSALVAGDGLLFTLYRVAHGEGGSRPFSDEETVVALDARTGDTRWELTYPSAVQDFGQGAGPHATPLLTGGRLFTVGTNKKLHAIDPASGRVLWRRDLVADFGAPPLLIRSMIKSGAGVSPLAYGDTIILQVGGPGQAVMALRQSDGSVVWRSGSFLVSESPAGLITVDGQRQVIVFAGQAVFGLDPDTGRVLWGHPHDAGNDFNFQVPLWNPADRLLFLSSGYIAGSRTLRLTRDGDATRVDELWSDPLLRFTFLNPLRLGDVVYGTSGQGATAVMTATQVATGETLWRARGFGRASLVQVGERTIVLEEDGDLSLVELAPTGLTTLATTTLFDTRSWTVPTLVGTTLYARDRARVVALDLGTTEAPVTTTDAARPDLSGLWTLDRSASTLTPPAFSGGRGGDDVDRLFVTHAANGTVVIGTETNGRKAWAYVPGETRRVAVGRDTFMHVTARWEVDRLVAEGRQDAMEMHEVLWLDGDRLRVEVTTTTADGVQRNDLVYTRDAPVGPCETWAMPCRSFADDVAPAASAR